MSSMVIPSAAKISCTTSMSSSWGPGVTPTRRTDWAEALLWSASTKNAAKRIPSILPRYDLPVLLICITTSPFPHNCRHRTLHAICLYPTTSMANVNYIFDSFHEFNIPKQLFFAFSQRMVTHRLAQCPARRSCKELSSYVAKGS